MSVGVGQAIVRRNQCAANRRRWEWAAARAAQWCEALAWTDGPLALDARLRRMSFEYSMEASAWSLATPIDEWNVGAGSGAEQRSSGGDPRLATPRGRPRR